MEYPQSHFQLHGIYIPDVGDRTETWGGASFFARSIYTRINKSMVAKEWHGVFNQISLWRYVFSPASFMWRTL